MKKILLFLYIFIMLATHPSFAETSLLNEPDSVSAVHDSKSGDIIVKLVNLLPVSVHASLQLKNISLEGCDITKTILSGKPDDKQVRTVSSEIELKNEDRDEMPAYSFTVIRITVSTGEKKQK